jgi:epoxide hydrolase-like predicted phosphatase
MRDAARRGSESVLFDWETVAVSEAEVVRALEPVLAGRASFATLRAALYADLQRNEPMIACMRRVHDRGVRLALLTNNVREAERDWRALVPEGDELFEVVVDSSRVGLRKPDPAIFELTLRRLGGIEPHQCLLVDDNLPNVEAARGLGMRALHFTDTSSAVAELEG